jgi:hypothetical protein
MKYGQKLKLGDAHVTPRNIQEVQASKLVKGHVPSFQFLGVCLQHKEINLVLSIAGILHVLHKTDGEEKWERGLL